MLARKILYYNTKTKLDLTKLFLLEVSQLHVQIYGRNLKKQKIKVKKSLFTFKNTDWRDKKGILCVLLTCLRVNCVIFVLK